MAETHHGEIDAVLVPDGQYQMEGLNNNLFLNYSRIAQINKGRFNFGPRKLIHAARFVEEAESGLYEKNDPNQKKEWKEAFDQSLFLPTQEQT